MKNRKIQVELSSENLELISSRREFFDAQELIDILESTTLDGEIDYNL